MEKPFFSVIIPCFNSEQWILRAIDSVQKQTFKDYELIIVDDCSTDKTREILQEETYGLEIILLDEKRFNGGARNVGVEEACGEYLIFLDADDEFMYRNFFQELYDLIKRENCPDMVRIPYARKYESGRETPIKFEETGKGIEEVIWSQRVAIWTKVIKRELFVPFPENTLNEDVPQHIAQCDKCKTVAWFKKGGVRWYIHSKSTSHAESPKWQTSIFRYVADLMDLELDNDWAKYRRDKKVKVIKKLVLDRLLKEFPLSSDS